MNSKVKLNEKWLKAAVIGTVWAASEIILGSFLHNLRLPFAGALLTSIGVVLLISISFTWKEKGIFWRAGVICALLKTMSPSAVIFGPMVAIIVESLLLEFSVRVFGRNYFGLTLGAVLAVSWSFAQKIITLLIFYGSNIVELYRNLMQYFEKLLNLQFDTIWLPILALFFIYVLIGITAGYLGITAGKRIVAQPLTFSALPKNSSNLESFNPLEPNYRYSLGWLGINVVLVIGSILSISLASWKVWAPVAILVLTLWMVKYTNALRQLAKPKFWMLFAFITILATFAFTTMHSKTFLESALIGIEMNARAAILIAGLSVVGKEMYNPLIKGFFANGRFRNLPVAIEVSAQSLPQVMANIPEKGTLLRKPIEVIHHLVVYANYRLAELRQQQNLTPSIIITGKRAAGKTSFVKKIVETLKNNDIRVGGIYSQKVYEGNQRVGYDVVDIITNDLKPFLRINDGKTENKVGMFGIIEEGYRFGLKSLDSCNHQETEIVVVDEIGELELTDNGWMSAVKSFHAAQTSQLLLVINHEHLEALIDKLGLINPHLIKIPTDDKPEVLERVVDLVKDNL